MSFVEDVVARHPGVVLESGGNRLPGSIEVFFPVGGKPEVGIRRNGSRRQRWAPRVLRQGIPVRDADGGPAGRAGIAEAGTPTQTEVHVEDDVEAVPVQHRDGAGDPVEIGLVDPAARRLELRPVDPKADDVEARLLHERGVHLVERRGRVFRVGDERVVIEAAKQHLAPGAVDDLPIAGAQPAHRRFAVARRRDRSRQASRWQVGDDRQDNDDEQQDETRAPQPGKAAPASGAGRRLGPGLPFSAAA